MELPDRDPFVENRPGPGLRQLRRAQTRGFGTGLRLGPGGNHLPRRFPGRRVQPGDGQRSRSRRSAGQQPESRWHQLHRFGRCRSSDRCELRVASGQGAAGNGRQEPADHSRRCRPQASGRAVGTERVLLHRPALHGFESLYRHCRHPRQVRRSHGRAHEVDQGRTRVEGWHRYRSGGLASAA
ncbi:hypothetical protein D3C78_1238980 [compost metagenome]